MLLRLYGETNNPKAEAVAKMADLMGEMGRNGLNDTEILRTMQRGYAWQSATCVQDSLFVMADNSEDALQRNLARKGEISGNGDGT